MNSSVELLRTIGSPLSPGVSDIINESQDMYQFAVKNKISLLYLEVLKQKRKLDSLKAKYDEELAKYVRTMRASVAVSHILGTVNINHAIFKSINPYPALHHDVDLLIMGSDKEYKKAVETLLRAGYKPELPDILDVNNLHNDNAYQKAARLLTKPTYGKMHISPTGTGLFEPDYGILIDLQKDLAMSYVLYMNKNKFREQPVQVELPEWGTVKCLPPKFDLACVIAHSAAEGLYLLGEYYNIAYHLLKMNEPDIEDFCSILKKNNMITSARSFTLVSIALHKSAFDTIPRQLEMLSDRLGIGKNGYMKNITKNSCEIPYRYKLGTITKIMLEKLVDRRFIISVLRQLIAMLDPSLIKLVAREVTHRLKRETY